MSNNPFDDKIALMRAYGLDLHGLSLNQFALYIKLVHEEFTELFEAADAVYSVLESSTGFEALTDEEKSEVANRLVAARNDMTKEAVDLLVVTIGLIVSMGVSPQSAWDLVHASNLSKLGDDGNPILREDGKVLKGPYYVAPNMADAEPMASLLRRVA